MQHDLVRDLLSIGRISLTPVVANGISEDISIATESSAGDGPANCRVSFETVLGVLIPEMESTVTAGSAEGAVDGVEADGVDGVNVCDVTGVGRRFAVALEGEVGGGVLLLDVLDSAAALNAADSEAGGIGEAADYAGLPLERGLHGLVEFGGVVEVNDVDVAVRRTDY